MPGGTHKLARIRVFQQPVRSWGKNHLIDGSGEIASSKHLVGPTVYFQKPQHVDLMDGNPIVPDGYDSNDRPFVWLPQQNPPVEPDGVLLTQDIAMQPSADAQGDTPDGPITIHLEDTSQFADNDEVFISDNGGPGGALRGDINEILSIDSSTQMTLKRGSNAFTVSDGGKVQLIRELGGLKVQTGGTGLSVYVTRDGDDLVFKDNKGSAITLDDIRQALNL